ncbi:preprotein translocase subunit SecE [Candidatus Saccharibacteria bacterium]|nr:preprotein translocase subunit SecE [Candidatus Saccharibacteria bacterium]
MAKKETKITRVKAKDTDSKPVKEVSKEPKMSKYAAKVAGVRTVKKGKIPAPKFIEILTKPFKFITAPFVALIKYLMDSWLELKLVRWPTRKETWKMTGAVIAFSVGFATLILLLDGLFNWIFKTLIK